MINIKQTQIILFAAITILSINSNLLSMDKRQQAKNQAAADRREQHRLQTALPTATIHNVDHNASYQMKEQINRHNLLVAHNNSINRNKK